MLLLFFFFFNNIRQEVLSVLMTLFWVWEETSRLLLMRVGCRTGSREPIPGWSACACSLGLGSCSVRIKNCPPTQSSSGRLEPSLGKIRNILSNRTSFLQISVFQGSWSQRGMKHLRLYMGKAHAGFVSPSRCGVIPVHLGLYLPRPQCC